MISEEIENELEALRAIYGDDFEDRPPVWKRPCFAIKVRPTTSVNGEVHVEATVNGYPRVAPKIEVEGSRGLVASDSKALNTKLQETAVQCTGHEMCHDIVTATQLFLEANNTKPQTFYEAMVSREKREVEALKKLRGKDLSSDGSSVPSSAAAKPAPAPLSVEMPSAGIINQDHNNKSLLESSSLDFKQSTDFITQQRKINKAKKATTKQAAGPTAVTTVAGSSPMDANAYNQEANFEPSQSVAGVSTLMNKQLTASKSNTVGPKSWLKLFINQDNDGDEEGDDEQGNTGEGESNRSGRHASKNHLVPVIGRPLASAKESNSRYWSEFIELSRLGSGASGQVWKVRNKLDRRIYAVKKIDLNAAENASAGQAKIRREVTTISRLLHKHVVRYYAAWVEETHQASNAMGDDGEDTNTNVTATLTMMGGASSNTGSASSSAASSPVKGPHRQPEYLQAVMGGYNSNSFMLGDLDDELSDARKQSAQDLWTFEETEMSAAAAQPRQQGTAKPVKGSRFFSYGSSSSSSGSDSGGSESSSSDSEDSSSESESDSDGSSSSSSSDDEVKGATDGIAAPGSAPARASHASSAKALTGDSTSRRSIPKSTAHPKLRRWMFIQMEYCYTTLREVIDQGQLWQQPAECGKLLRQLVEALAYIHDRRVIHRDLKPANIFLDAEGNIKIGDFGLATFTTDSTNTTAGHISASASATNLYNLTSGLQDLSPMGAADDSFFMSRNASNVSLSQMENTGGGSVGSDALLSNSLTGGIGTAMYRAPEQEYRPREAGSTDRGYDDKADMFSLGVILFEMCHAPFGTGMERLITMKKLREHAELPADFGEAFSTPALGSIVRWLVQQDPTQRPSARQLLESSLLPARVDTDSKYLKEITEALWKPNSSAAAGIISVLFNNSMNLSKGTLGPGPPVQGAGGVSSSRAFQQADTLPAVSYDLEILQQNLNLLQPRPLPKGSAMNIPMAATKAQKQQLRLQAPQKERYVVSLQYSAALKRLLKQVFEAHGAVSYAPGLLQLRSNPGLALMMRNADRAVASLLGTSEEKTAASSRSPAVAQFLDPMGQVVVLPSDLVTPFAKVVAFLNLQHSHRYNVSQVYTSLVPPDSASAEAQSIPNSAAVSNQDHPFISEEAVYDVILPQNGPPSADGTSAASEQSVLQADFDVLTAAIEVMSSIQQYLPDCAVRVSDPRIMDAIIELCAWQLPTAESEAIVEKSATSKGIKQVDSIGDLVLTVIDREALCKVISLASDGVLPVGEVMRLVSDLKLPAVFLKRLLPFVQVMCSPQERRPLAPTPSGSYLQQGAAVGPRRDPLHLLDALEQEFYRSEIIVDIQRRLASGPAPASKPEKEKAAKPVQETVVAQPAPAVSDFTPLDLGHIGKKQARKKDAAVAAHVAPLAPPIAPVVHKVEDPFKEDRKRIRTIIKTFDSSINHLRHVVKAALNCMYGIQQFGTASLPLGFAGGASSSALILLVDLGKDPRYISSRAGSSMLCPFHARGVYFVIESYLFPSEQFLQQQLQQTKLKDKVGGAVDPELVFRCSRRRHNRFGGVLGEGGHFEHLVETYRDHFQSVGGDSGGADDKRVRAKVVACALRLKPDAIASLISKYEARQKKITDHLLSRGSSSRYFFVDRFKPDLVRLLDSNQSHDVLLTMDAPSHNSAARTKEEAASNTGILHSVLLLLRRHGIRASDRPHQLHGATRGFMHPPDSSSVVALCGELGIPFAVTIQPDAHNKFVLQYCGDVSAPDGTSTGAGSAQQQPRPVTVSLLDLPRMLTECIKALRAAESGKFSLSAVVSALAADASPVARSPGRAGSSGAGSSSSTSTAVDGSSGASAGTAAGASTGAAGAASGGGKNQKVRFGSFDIKNPSPAPSGTGADAADGSATSAGTMTPSARTEKIVHIVIMEAGGGGSGAPGSSQGGHGKDWQQYGNPKEKKQAMVKRKELEQAPAKVRAILVNQLLMLYPGGDTSLPVTITTTVRSLGTAYTPGQVLAVEAPFLMLRGLCTILMTRLQNAMTSSLAREEYDALAAGAYADSSTSTSASGAGPTSGNYRKVLKQVVVQLLTYAKQVAGSGNNVTASSGSAPVSKSSSAPVTSASSTPAAALSPMLQLYLYSVADNQMDLLCCDAKALLNAKLS